jgi:outer membrane lipoprotein-sorting protein
MVRQALLSLAAVAAIAAPPPSADDVVAKSVEARGGLQKLHAVQSLRMTGSMSMGAMEMPLVLEWKRPSFYRAEFTLQGKTAVQAYDGQQAWVIPPVDERRPQALPPEAAKQMAQQADVEGALIDYKAKGHKVELVGREKRDGTDVYRLKLTRRSGDVEQYLIDATSWLPVRVEATRTIEGSTVVGEATLADYRDFGGVKWPTSIENAVKGRPEKQTITFTNIEVNPPLEEARFKMPAAAPSSTPRR